MLRTASSSRMVPLICLGGAYTIGVLFEAWSRLPPLKWFMDKQDERSFAKAFKIYTWLHNECKPKLDKEDEQVEYRHKAWDWLTLNDAQPNAFTHAHRFQAEARLCFNSSISWLLFTLAVGISLGWCGTWHRWWVCLVGFAMFLLFACGSYAREKRRWFQMLIAADHLKWIPTGTTTSGVPKKQQS